MLEIRTADYTILSNQGNENVYKTRGWRHEKGGISPILECQALMPEESGLRHQTRVCKNTFQRQTLNVL